MCTIGTVPRVDFEQLSFAVNAVRVELNTALVPGFNQLDAIKLIGAPVTDFEPIFIRYEGDVGTNALQLYNTRTWADYDNDGGA